MQQQKTTVVHISALWWTAEQPKMRDSVLSAELAVAVRIAGRCHMDILSITHHADPPELVTTTVVYLSNGMSTRDIVEQMRPEINNKPNTYWMVLDMEAWQGLLHCTISVRGTYEEWEA